MRSTIIGISLLLATLFFGCDEIDPPYLQDGGNVTIDTNKKNVLIEYHTGVKCGNCPPAAVVGKNLVEQYSGKVIMIANHVGVFAVPDQNGEKYTTDYRCEVGQELDKFYGVGSIGTPLGIINRSEYQNSLIHTHSKWEAAVNAQLEQSAEVLIEMEADYNENTREISLDATIEYLKNSNENHLFVVYIVESGIIDYQKWYGHDPEDIPDYKQPTTLRSSMNSAWGKPIDAFSNPAGGEIEVSLSYTIPADSDWVVENLKLVGVVYKEDKTRSIDNVEMIELISE